MDHWQVDSTTGCWIWGKACGGSGYGVAHIRGRTITAHKKIYEQYKGLVPARLELDHTCRKKCCVNPNHLEPVTHSENMKRHSPFSTRVQSDVCKYGHLLDGLRTRAEEGRYCKTCVLERKRARRAMGLAN